MFPFTRELHYPDDGNREPWEVTQRWRQDDKRLPVRRRIRRRELAVEGPRMAYSNICRMGLGPWMSTSSRQAGPHEQHQEQGRGEGRQLCRRQWFPHPLHDIGLHAPPAECNGVEPNPCITMRYTQDENMLRRRVQGTVFELEALLHVPGFLSPDQCINQMEFIFKDVSGDGTCQTAKLPWRTIRPRLRQQEAAVHSLQRLWAHEILRGHEDGPMGPRARSARETAQAWAYLGMQRAAGKSRRGLDHLLQPGLARDRHMETATALPSPYRPGTTTDPDLKFAAYTMAVWGPSIGPWREQQRLLLTGFVKALQPMTEVKRRRMPESVMKHVAVKKNPALIAFFTVLIRWLDSQLALEYIKGHQIVGHIEPSGVFRARGGGEISEAELQKGFLGDEVVTSINKMMSRPPRKDSEDIEKLMEAGTKKGHQSTPAKKAEMDNNTASASGGPCRCSSMRSQEGSSR